VRVSVCETVRACVNVCVSVAHEEIETERERDRIERENTETETTTERITTERANNFNIIVIHTYTDIQGGQGYL